MRSSHAPLARRSEGWFYSGMAVVTLTLSLVGFGPAIWDPTARLAPLSLAVAAHGAVFTAWLVLFLAQTQLVSRGNLAAHRRAGMAGVLLAILMVATGFATCRTMARRGFDLSGELQANRDPLFLLVFQFGDLLAFGLLVSAAIICRHNPDAHKRLMLLATTGTLMPASLSHIIGHFTILRDIDAPVILIPFAMLLASGALHDFWTRGRVHPVSLWGALAVFGWANLRATVIGPSEWWHRLAAWLVA